MNHEHDPSPYEDDMPPHDPRAEQAVLGAVISSPAAREDVGEMLAANHFYKPVHGQIFATAIDLTIAGHPVDIVTMHNELDRLGLLAKVGGLPYLHTLLAACPSFTAATHYADIVLTHYKRRRMLEAGQHIVQLGRTGGGADIDHVIENARQAIDQVAHEGRSTTDDLDLGSALAGLLDELDSPAPPSLPTGLHDLDDVLSGGLYAGQLVVIGARPGIGKSVMGLGTAIHTAKMGRGALFASLEMSRGDCMRRLVAAEGSVELTRLVQHQLTQDDWRRATEVQERASEWPLHIDPRPHQTLTSIRAKARDITRTEAGLSLVVVDYVQLLGSGGGKSERRDLEIGTFTRGLKLLAKELEVPVVAISQVNRGSEQRADKKPTMSDLRESGSIEADADTVILLHRTPEAPMDIEAIVAKQRQGPTRSVTLRWRGHYSRIDNAAVRHLEAM